MTVKSGKINLIEVELSDELATLLNSSEQNLPELTKISNNAAWYVDKPELKSE